MQRPQDKTVLAMVGLPARGKSFIGRKIARYFNWRGHNTRVFNVGGYRRAELGDKHDASFFAPDNADASAARDAVAIHALEDLLAWLAGDGKVGILDATNSTPARRALIAEHCTRAGVQLTFVETVCDNETIIEANIRATKLALPDYVGIAPEQAAADFQRRIAEYARAYVTIDDPTQSFIKLITLPDGQQRVVVNRVEAPLALRAAQLLVGHKSGERTIWLTRHGESLFNVEQRIGGDSPLSERGVTFARRLAAYFADQPDSKPVVWTSTLVRTRETAAQLNLPHRAWRALDEIDAGVCDGMTYEQIATTMPDEYQRRQADKLGYRYPRGESYLDVIHRLDPLISEMERVSAPLLVIGHQAVLRALYAYLVGEPLARCPFLDIPLHTVIELAPGGALPREERVALGPDRS
jgi:broad specificity phosphatase PhoE/predicted kinase